VRLSVLSVLEISIKHYTLYKIMNKQCSSRIQVSPHEVCGCPLSNDQLEETKDLCCVSKRNCVRHYCWEKLRRAQIDGERVRQVKYLNTPFR
jgi:hypothetical protein